MLVTTKAIAERDTATFPLKGMPNRVAVTPHGVYAALRANADSFLRIAKWNLETDTVTLFNETTKPLDSTPQTAIAMVSQGNILHVVWYTTVSAQKVLVYRQFDTSVDQFVGTAETIDNEGIALSNADVVDITVSEDIPHVAYWNKTSSTEWKIRYAHRTGGTWTKQTILTNTRAPAFVPRVDVAGGRVVVLYDNGLQELTIPNQWSVYEVATAVTVALEGYGQATIAHTGDGARHVLFQGDKRHTVATGTFAVAESAFNIKYEAPDTEGPVIDGVLTSFGDSIYTDGSDMFAFSSAGGIMYQARYKEGTWGPYRAIKLLSSSRTTECMTQVARNGLFGIAKSNASAWFFFEADTDSPPRGGLTHSLVIDGEGFNTQGQTGKAVISQVIPRISVATEVKKEEDLTDLSSITQETFHHGRGERAFANPFAFFDSDNALTHITGQVTPQYANYLTLKEGSGSGGAAMVGGTQVTVGPDAAPIGPELSDSSFADFGGFPVDGALYQGNFYVLIRGDAAADNDLYVWDNTNGEWDVVAAGLDVTTGDPQDLEIHVQDLWVAQGDSVNARVYNFSGTSWVNANAPAYCFKSFDDVIFRADNINEIYFSADAHNDPTAATWTLLGYVDDGSGTTGRIRRFEVYGGTLLVFADFGVYQILPNGNGTYLLLPLLDDSAQRHANNGSAAAIFGGVLHYNVGDGITRFDGSTRQDVGPNRSALAGSDFQPLPLTKRGTISYMVATDTLLYAAINAEGRTNAVSTVMVTAGTGWHEFWQTNAANRRCKWIFYTPKLTSTGVLSKRNLWVNQGNNIYYVPLPDATENPLNDTTMVYKTGSHKIITGWMTGSLPALRKTLHKLVNRSENLGPGEYDRNIHIYFQTEEGDDTFDEAEWVYLTTFTSGDEEIDIISRSKRAAFPTEYSGSIGGLSYKQIRFMIVMDSNIGGPTITTTPVVLRAFGSRFAVRPDTRWGWTTIIQASDEMIRLDGVMEVGRAKDVREHIYTFNDSEGPHFIDDGTLQAAINHVKNPSFEINSSGLADLWRAVGSPVTVRSQKHKIRGRYSQKITVPATTTTTGIEQGDIMLPAGTPCLFGISLFVESGEPVVMRVIDFTSGTILGESEPVYPSLSVRPQTRFDDVFVEIEPQSILRNVAIQLLIPSSLTSGTQSSIYYVDAAFCYFASDNHHYLDGDQPRCQWEGNNTEPHLNKSFCKGTYAAYVTQTNDVFRARKRKTHEVTLESHLTLEIREAAS